MYCPVCKDEFRPGFTRCGACDVELVEDLTAAAASPASVARRELPPEGADPVGPVEMVEFCGFLALGEARDARNTLRESGIRSEIVIREAPDSPPEGEIREEYWLRVERSGYALAAQRLGYDLEEERGGEAGDDEDAEAGERTRF